MTGNCTEMEGSIGNGVLVREHGIVVASVAVTVVEKMDEVLDVEDPSSSGEERVMQSKAQDMYAKASENSKAVDDSYSHVTLP